MWSTRSAPALSPLSAVRVPVCLLGRLYFNPAQFSAVADAGGLRQGVQTRLCLNTQMCVQLLALCEKIQP